MKIISAFLPVTYTEEVLPDRRKRLFLSFFPPFALKIERKSNEIEYSHDDTLALPGRSAAAIKSLQQHDNINAFLVIIPFEILLDFLLYS